MTATPPPVWVSVMSTAELRAIADTTTDQRTRVEALAEIVRRAVEWASRAEAELRGLQQQLAAAQAQTELLAAELIERAAPR